MISSAVYANLNFDGNEWEDSYLEIGPLWHVRIWYLGRYLSTLLGGLFWCYLTLGGVFLWMTSEPIIHQSLVVKPYLQLGRKLLITCTLLYLVAWMVDSNVHIRRHRKTRVYINYSQEWIS
jgi:hypothetical protein